MILILNVYISISNFWNSTCSLKSSLVLLIYILYCLKTKKHFDKYTIKVSHLKFKSILRNIKKINNYLELTVKLYLGLKVHFKIYM